MDDTVKKDMQLQDRVAIVTGAGGGLGKSHAQMLASLGAKVVVNDMNEDAAARVAEELKGKGADRKSVV